MHEHLDEMGIIHMNGRIYDPLMGRFMSADPTISNPFNLQSFNRYSYVRNNPLKLYDPTGLEETGGNDGFGTDSDFGAGGVWSGCDSCGTGGGSGGGTGSWRKRKRKHIQTQTQRLQYQRKLRIQEKVMMMVIQISIRIQIY